MSISIIVTDRNSVPFYAKSNVTHIISIGNYLDFPDLGCFTQSDFTLHRFTFNDISHEADGGPQRFHIERLIQISQSILNAKFDAKILFHCQAGISRSTAMAFIFMVLCGLSYQDAYHSVQKARGCTINPNELMAKYADDILGHEGRLAAFIKSTHIG